MIKLIRAGIRRYVRSRVFWLAFIVTEAVSILCGNSTRNIVFDDIYIIVELFTFAVMISWFVGRENEEGIFRNKVISGHSKGSIYLSELILGIGTCLILFLLFAIIFSCYNSYVFSVVSFGTLVKIFIDSLLVNACFAAIFVTSGCLISNRIIIVIVNIFLVLGIVFASYEIETILSQEEYYTKYGYVYKEASDTGGNTVLDGGSIERSEQQVKNPYYIGEPIRSACELAYNILPYGHMTEYIHFTSNWFGHNYYAEYGVPTGETAHKEIKVSEDTGRNIDMNLMWSAVITFWVCGTGYLCFRKKELK